MRNRFLVGNTLKLAASDESSERKTSVIDVYPDHIGVYDPGDSSTARTRLAGGKSIRKQ
jgi:hypothetical protein